MRHSKITPKFIILDRDGTIIEDLGYVHKIKDLKFLPNAISGLKQFRDAGFRFIIITNQAGIARGIFTSDQLDIFQNELLKQLADEGISIDKIYYCPHHPDITGPCKCRKPKTKLAEEAAERYGFSAEECIIIGDKDSDIEFGLNFGSKTILIENGQYKNLVTPHFKARDLNHAFERLKKANLI